ncbi:response regulator [Patescibacteria group bacterium]|nr:response regulator [Patescibacteria group bacterium]
MRILLIDDSDTDKSKPELQDVFQDLMKALGHEVILAKTIFEGFFQCGRGQIDCIVTDLFFQPNEEPGAFSMIRFLTNQECNVPIIVVFDYAYFHTQIHQQAVELGFFEIIDKTNAVSEIKTALQKITDGDQRI